MTFSSVYESAMVYLDHNATTPHSGAAQKWMNEALQTWGNPSSPHGVGRIALELLEKSRAVVSRVLGAKTEELVFTSGGSESNTSVLLGKALLERQMRLVVSPVEHASIRDLLPILANLGCTVETLRLLPNGELDLNYLKGLLESFRPQLISVMVANNETGIVFPISSVAELCRAQNVELHCDAVQALGKLPPSTWAEADYVSFSAHKIGGPKGIGVLRVRSGKQLNPTHFGGSQEIKRRGGTQNMVGIAGFAGALSDEILQDELGVMERLRDDFEKTVIEKIEGVSIQGRAVRRVPHTSNIRIAGIKAESLLTALDLDGICLSAGSACSSGATKPSPVLINMGMSPEAALECFRVSLGRHTTEKEMDYCSERIVFHTDRIRSRKGRS